MAMQGPSTERREFLALIGRSPLNPVIVETRPTSFADALTQYRRLCEERTFIHPVDDMTEQAFDMTSEAALEAMEAMLALPARTIADVREKLAAVSREFAGGDVPIEHIDIILADIITLGGKA